MYDFNHTLSAAQTLLYQVTNMRFPPLLLLLLLAKTIGMALMIHSEMIGLGPDEAQYWTWSQQLDVGYYSKPPGIAWQIALGTELFGNTEFGVRFGSLVIGFILPLVVYELARACRLQPSTCFWAAIVMAFSPLGFLASFLAITDDGMVLSWAIASLLVCKALKDEQPLPYYAIGLAVLFGVLFKWPTYLFWLFVLALGLWQRRYLSWHLVGGIAVSLLGLLPSLIWNSQHDYATFRHVFSTIYGKETIDVGTTTLLKGNFLEFLGAQSLLLSPILFVCLIIAYIVMIKEWSKLNLGLQFCGASSLSVLVMYSSYSFFKKLQGNWSDFVYPAAFIVLVWFACEWSRKAFGWLIAGVATSVALVILLFTLQQPFKHNLGWIALKQALVDEGYNPAKQFLVSDKYQTTSLLSFYAPEQKRAYFLNLHNLRRNQFSYWPGLEIEQMGNSGLFVTVEPASSSEEKTQALISKTETALKPYFDEVHFLGVYTLVSWRNKPMKNAYIFSCIGYNGKLPETTASY